MMGWLIVCNGVGSDNNLQQKLGRSFGLFQVKQDKLNNVVAIHNFARAIACVCGEDSKGDEAWRGSNLKKCIW